MRDKFGRFVKGNKINLGRKHTEQSKENNRQAHLGQRNSLATEFKKGHIPFSKLHPEDMPRGEEHPKWRGGKIKDSCGYILILKHKHPYCNHLGYVFEHRLVVEKQIRRYLLPKEQVHHLGAKDDNKPCMLMAFISFSPHRRFENGKEIKPEEIIFDGRKLCRV